VALLLAEVFERRTGLLSRRRRITWGGGREPPAPAGAGAQNTVLPSQKAPLPAAAPPPSPATAEQPGLLEAIRKARQRTRGGG
jgi:hypothetical protein